MKIALVLDDDLDKKDGVQQAVLMIGEGLRARKHEVHYLVTNTTRNDLDNVHSLGRSVSFKFNGNSIRTPLPTKSRNIKKIMREYQFDIVHIQMPFSPFFGAKIIKYAGTNSKIYGTFHILPYNLLSKYGTKLVGYVMRKSIKRIDTIYAVSLPALRFMELSFNESGRVLPNPVNYEYFNKFKKQKSNKIEITFVGRFDERKGVMELLEAFLRLDSSIKDKINITMCGKGRLHARATKFAKSNKIDVNFPGFVTDDEKAQYLANADIAVFPSISGESFGIVLTEAMSAGAGVTLGGNNPGYSSVLEQWPETLFNASNPKEIANKLEEVITNYQKYEIIGVSQHNEVKKYSTEKVLETLEDDYKNSFN